MHGQSTTCSLMFASYAGIIQQVQSVNNRLVVLSACFSRLPLVILLILYSTYYHFHIIGQKCKKQRQICEGVKNALSDFLFASKSA